jgi:hypothetical protein
LTGDFHSSFFAKTDSFPVAFDARDEKTSELKQKYGEIFGLDETSLEEYRQEIKPEVQGLFRELLSP